MSQDDRRIPDTIVQEHYVAFQHEFIEFLVAQLVDFRKMFHGDLDELLVFIFVARYSLREERGRTGDEQDAPSSVAFPTLARVAESTGIPRETVRRKLIALQSRGLLEKGDHDKWRPAMRNNSPVIRQEYEQLCQREMRRLVKLVQALKPYV